MALTTKQRAEIEDELSKLAVRLPDSPVQAMNVINNKLRSYGIHQSQLRVVIVTEEYMQRDLELRQLREWLHLKRTLGSGCPWTDFFKACARKVNVDEAWMGKIATVVGVRDALHLSYYERHISSVPYEWLEKVMTMPDLQPDQFVPRSNYAEVCEPLESTLRAAGKTAVWTANILSKFVAEFNGTKVTLADVRSSKTKGDTQHEASTIGRR